MKYTPHENTFVHYVRKRNPKWVKLKKGRQSRNTWRSLWHKSHFRIRHWISWHVNF